jgi:hypothetical protein
MRLKFWIFPLALIVVLFYHVELKSYYRYLLICHELSSVIDEYDSISSDQIGILTPLDSNLVSYDYIYFRYSELNCKVCVDHIFVIINDVFSPDLLIDSVYLLIDYENERYLEFFKRRNSFYSSKIFKVPSYTIFQEVDRLNVPYFFTLNDSGHVETFFVVMNELPERTLKYSNSLSLAK